MAQTHNHPRPAEVEATAWTQPLTVIPIATDSRGHYHKMPELAPVATIAERFGPAVAEIYLDAMRQYALRAAQARAKGKGVADSLAAERDASGKALAEIATGAYKSRDTDPNNAIKSSPEFLGALRDHLKRLHPNADITDAVVEATAKAHGDRFLASLGDDFIAGLSYTPTKRGTKGEAANVLTV